MITKSIKQIIDGDRIILVMEGLSDDDMKKVDAFVTGLGAQVHKNATRGLIPMQTCNTPDKCTYRYSYGPYKGMTFFESLKDGQAALYALEHLSEFPSDEAIIVKEKIRNVILYNLSKRDPETDDIEVVRRFGIVFNVKPFAKLFNDVRNISGFRDVNTLFQYGNAELVREAYAGLIEGIKDAVSKL